MSCNKRRDVSTGAWGVPGSYCLGNEEEATKIKIEREEKLDVIVNGSVYKVGSLYHVIAGEDRNHAYIVTQIYKIGRDWMLKLGEYDYDIEIRGADLQVSDMMNFKVCDCNFLCQGYILKSFNWNSH